MSYIKNNKVIIFKIQHHLFANDGMLQIPQVFPLANLMYPDSPHEFDHEFFIFQYWSVTPTNKTP
jgi:hypothetical protein